MKNLKVVVISPGLSGAGLISDYLLNRNDFASPFNLESEFRLLHDPGGIHNLYCGLYENFSVNNSAYFFNEFEKYISRLKNLSVKKKNKKKYLYNSLFFIEVEKYLKQISKINYYGLPEFFRLGLNFRNKLKWRILRINKTSQEVKFCKMRIPVEKKIFLKNTKIFLNKILYILSGKKKNYVIDQGGNFWDPIKSTQYFDRRKIILVTRDPRSIFSSMKTRKSLAYPGHNIRIFCEWYKNIMKNYNTVKESNLLIKIKYEKFINDYDNQSKKLCKFLSIKKLSKFDYNINISKKNLYKAKNNLTKSELNYISKKLKKFIQW
tara:strand:+ start:22 stop:984 length:963 start_codon:yes stop_codon:yes gene_type:complete